MTDFESSPFGREPLRGFASFGALAALTVLLPILLSSPRGASVSARAAPGRTLPWLLRSALPDLFALTVPSPASADAAEEVIGVDMDNADFLSSAVRAEASAVRALGASPPMAWAADEVIGVDMANADFLSSAVRGLAFADSPLRAEAADEDIGVDMDRADFLSSGVPRLALGASPPRSTAVAVVLGFEVGLSSAVGRVGTSANDCASDVGALLAAAGSGDEPCNWGSLGFKAASWVSGVAAASHDAAASCTGASQDAPNVAASWTGAGDGGTNAGTAPAYPGVEVSLVLVHSATAGFCMYEGSSFTGTRIGGAAEKTSRRPARDCSICSSRRHCETALVHSGIITGAAATGVVQLLSPVVLLQK